MFKALLLGVELGLLTLEVLILSCKNFLSMGIRRLGGRVTFVTIFEFLKYKVQSRVPQLERTSLKEHRRIAI